MITELYSTFVVSDTPELEKHQGLAQAATLRINPSEDLATVSESLEDAEPLAVHQDETPAVTPEEIEVTVDGQTITLNMPIINPYKDVYLHGGNSATGKSINNFTKMI